MDSRRTNPVRAARSPPIRDETDDSDGIISEASQASEDSSFFSPSESERGCPTCRKVPTDSLRLYPDTFKCPICLTEEVTNVFAFVPCGHCICGDCKNMWMPCTTSPLPNISNLNISNTSSEGNRGGASVRRGRPLMSPYERSAASTRQRKQTILTSIENWQFNNGIIMDTIFYCDIPETFQSPDEEPREVFRQRLTDVMNTEENGDFGEENSWVISLKRVSVHFEGDNPLEFVNYTITKNYDNLKLSLKIPSIKGLKHLPDVFGCILNKWSTSDYEELEIEQIPTRAECIDYFANSINIDNVTMGEELVDPSFLE